MNCWPRPLACTKQFQITNSLCNSLLIIVLTSSMHIYTFLCIIIRSSIGYVETLAPTGNCRACSRRAAAQPGRAAQAALAAGVSCHAGDALARYERVAADQDHRRLHFAQWRRSCRAGAFG